MFVTILIVITHLGMAGADVVTMQEFATETACQNTMELVQKETKGNNTKVFCVAKVQ